MLGGGWPKVLSNSGADAEQSTTQHVFQGVGRRGGEGRVPDTLIRLGTRLVSDNTIHG